MKICPVCHTESDENAKFCPECGSSFSQSDGTDSDQMKKSVSESDSTASAGSEPVQTDDLSSSVEELILTKDPAETEEIVSEVFQPADPVPSNERWYYVESGKSLGPYSRDEFMDLITQGTVRPDTYVWSKGMDEWTYLKNTDLYTPAEAVPEVSSIVPELKEPVFQEIETFESNSSPSKPDPQDVPAADQPKAEAQEWYYVVNNRTVGPFSESVMIQNVQQGVLVANTYVWKEGYPDWKHLSDTPLAAWLPASRMDNPTTFSAPSQHSSYGRTTVSGPVPVRNILLYLLLTVLTCGFFAVIWLYLMASDINRLCQQKGRPPLTDPILVVVFSILTCQIFTVYYFWKAGNTVYELSDRRLSDNSMVLAILGIFLMPAGLAILQDQINSLVESGEYH